MSQNNEQVAKPFEFVPFPTKSSRQATKGHDIYHAQDFSGKFSYRLVALTPIHIASGTYALSPEEVALGYEGIVRDCYRVGDRPAIPGSSLKGMVRAIVEAVSASCVMVTKVETDQLPGGEKLTRGCQPDRACPACSMFGRLNRLGKVSFSDALLEPGQRTEPYHLPSLHRPHPDSPVYLDETKHYKGRKFYYHGQPGQSLGQPIVEVIPKKGELKGDFEFINLTVNELGLLFFALGLDNTFRPKLGGGKSVCLGSIRIIPLELVFRDKEDWIDYEGNKGERYKEEKSLQGLIRIFIKQATSAKGYLIRDQVRALRKILRYPNDRDCPQGNY